MTNEQIFKELWNEAIKRGKMGDEDISITLEKESVNTDTLCDGISYEIDGDAITLSCEAEMVYTKQEENKMKYEDMTKEEYVAFMCNIENSHKCDCCPENNKRGNVDLGILPCGQYGCWVNAHCRN